MVEGGQETAIFLQTRDKRRTDEGARRIRVGFLKDSSGVRGAGCNVGSVAWSEADCAHTCHQQRIFVDQIFPV